MEKCDVCGKEGEVCVCASVCGPVSLAYCKECLESCAEPWGFLVTCIANAGYYPDEISDAYRKIVINTCKRLNRNESEFIADVERAIKRL